MSADASAAYSLLKRISCTIVKAINVTSSNTAIKIYHQKNVYLNTQTLIGKVNTLVPIIHKFKYTALHYFKVVIANAHHTNIPIPQNI